MPIETHLEGGMTIVITSVAREREQLRPAPGEAESLANGMRDHVTVDAWQANVEQHDIGAEVLELRESGCAVMRHLHFVMIDLQQRAQGFRRIRIVFDDEHASRAHDSRWLVRWSRERRI